MRLPDPVRSRGGSAPAPPAQRWRLAGRHPALQPIGGERRLLERHAPSLACSAAGRANSGPGGRDRQLHAGAGGGGGLQRARAVRRRVCRDAGQGEPQCLQADVVGNARWVCLWKGGPARHAAGVFEAAHALKTAPAPRCYTTDPSSPLDLSHGRPRRRWGGAAWNRCCWMRWGLRRCRRRRCGTATYCSRSWCTTFQSRWVGGWVCGCVREGWAVDARHADAEWAGAGAQGSVLQGRCSAAACRGCPSDPPPGCTLPAAAAAGRAGAVCRPVRPAGARRLRCHHHAASGSRLPSVCSCPRGARQAAMRWVDGTLPEHIVGRGLLRSARPIEPWSAHLPAARLPAHVAACRRSGGSTSRTIRFSRAPWRRRASKWRCVDALHGRVWRGQFAALGATLAASGALCAAGQHLRCPPVCSARQLLPARTRPTSRPAPICATGAQVHVHEYPAALAKSTWLAMVAAKFWSTFAHCTAAELEQVGGWRALRRLPQPLPQVGGSVQEAGTCEGPLRTAGHAPVSRPARLAACPACPAGRRLEAAHCARPAACPACRALLSWRRSTRGRTACASPTACSSWWPASPQRWRRRRRPAATAWQRKQQQQERQQRQEQVPARQHQRSSSRGSRGSRGSWLRRWRRR